MNSRRLNHPPLVGRILATQTSMLEGVALTVPVHFSDVIDNADNCSKGQ